MGSNPETQPLPFWQVNVRPEDRKEECPEALRNLSDKDMEIIGTRDEDYHVQSWEEVVYFVRKQRLADFRRWPTELRRYREFVWRLGREKGGVMGYILRERLHWTLPLIPRSSKPFECDEDYKILWNDWPYGIDNRIVHLVVWTKFELQDDNETEAEIEKFIKRTFLSTVAEDQVSCSSFGGPDLRLLTKTLAHLVQEPAKLEVCPLRRAHPCDAVLSRA